MSTDMSGAVCEIENHIQKSLESQGQDITIIRQGYLHKRSSNIQRNWKKRFFVLDSMGMLYYYSSKVVYSLDVYMDLTHKPQLVLVLQFFSSICWITLPSTHS